MLNDGHSPIRRCTVRPKQYNNLGSDGPPRGALVQISRDIVDGRKHIGPYHQCGGGCVAGADFQEHFVSVRVCILECVSPEAVVHKGHRDLHHARKSGASRAICCIHMLSCTQRSTAHAKSLHISSSSRRA